MSKAIPPAGQPWNGKPECLYLMHPSDPIVWGALT